uniref:Ribosomal protein S7 n=1 Tax=Lotharella vacuolata TaxID=74820 RepID=A0A0H5BGX6_9EUKA|nr:hypothetical protein [Lotharella vacuolata]
MATLIQKSIKGHGISGYTIKMINFLKNNKNNKSFYNTLKKYKKKFNNYNNLISILTVKLRNDREVIKKIMQKCFNYFKVIKNQKFFYKNIKKIKYNKYYKKKNNNYFIKYLVRFNRVTKIYTFNINLWSFLNIFLNQAHIYSGITLYKYLFKKNYNV